MSHVQLTLEEYEVLLNAKRLAEKIVVGEYTYTTGESIGIKISKDAVEAAVKEIYKSEKELSHVTIEDVTWVNY